MPRFVEEVLPSQADFLNYDGDIALLVGGFAAGKSLIAARWFCDRLMQFPMGAHAIVCKDLPQAKRGPIQTLKGVLSQRKIEHTYNQSTGELTISSTGARIIVLSAANYLSFRALELDTIWADEIASWGPSAETAFTQYLAPRLRYSPLGMRYKKIMKPQMRITTNPSPLGGWLHKLVVTNNYCKWWCVSLRDNYLMQDLASYIDRAERSMSKDLWPFLIDGKWGSVTTGSVYSNFTRSICTPDQAWLPPLKIDLYKPLLWAHDFNVSMMCSSVSQMHKQNILFDMKQTWMPKNFVKTALRKEHDDFQPGILYVIDEIVCRNAGAPNVLEEFLKRYGDVAKQTGVILYGDAAGGARSQQIDAQQSARSNWAIIIDGLKKAGIKVEFRVPSVNPSVIDRVNSVKAQIMTKDGRGLLINFDAAPVVTRDLEAVLWLEGKNDIDKRNLELTHSSDALGYLIWAERTLSINGEIKFKTRTDV